MTSKQPRWRVWAMGAGAALLLATVGCRKSAEPPAEGGAPSGAAAARCEGPLADAPDEQDAQRAACRSLCESGSVVHCTRLAAVCGAGIPGGTLCPGEMVWAGERACELGSAADCLSAARTLREGMRGVDPDPGRAEQLAGKACALDPSLCPSIPPAEADAALAELTAVPVPGGTFRPGYRPYDTPGQPEDFRLPPIEVGPFDIDRTEVTVGAYAACVNAGACPQPRTGGACTWGVAQRTRYPINCVTLGDAAAFCAWRGRRLPSQDEWELAARGSDDDRPYPWGDAAPSDQLCWNRQGAGPCEVGAYPQGASPFGVLDLEGNVEEWTTATVYVTNAAVFHDAVVARGSSWDDSGSTRMGLNNQHYHESGDALPQVGFRCAGGGKPAVGGPPEPGAGGV